MNRIECVIKPLAAYAAGLRQRAAALAAGWSLAAVAAASGFISYTHISALTLLYWQNWKTAHLMPLPVDGQIVIGTVYFMDGKNNWQKAGGLVLGVLPGIMESLYANWQSVAPPPGVPALALLEAHLWATVPAQAFACSTFLFERWLANRKAAAGAVTETAGVLTEPRPQAGEPSAPGLQPPAVSPRRMRPAAADDTRLPLPEDEAELVSLVRSTTRNELFRTYQVSKTGADKLRAKYLTEDPGQEAEEDAA